MNFENQFLENQQESKPAIALVVFARFFCCSWTLGRLCLAQGLKSSALSKFLPAESLHPCDQLCCGALIKCCFEQSFGFFLAEPVGVSCLALGMHRWKFSVYGKDRLLVDCCPAQSL